jgi:hypothetical protein
VAERGSTYRWTNWACRCHSRSLRGSWQTTRKLSPCLVSARQAVIGDKGYDSDALVEHIEAAGAKAVVPREAMAESSADMMNTSIESATRSNAVPASSSNFFASPDSTRNHKPAFTPSSHWPAHGSSSNGSSASYTSIRPRNSLVTIHLSPEYPHHARHDTSATEYQLLLPFAIRRSLSAANQYPRSV